MQFCGLKYDKRPGGFTLIELLVVVAVIAILLAILMPAMRKAKALTKRVACQSNLKQIAVAWNMYLDDNDGRFYQGRNANLNYGGWKGMQGWSPRPLNTYFNLPEDLEIENDGMIFCCSAAAVALGNAPARDGTPSGAICSIGARVSAAKRCCFA